MRFRLANNASQSPVDGIGRGMETLFNMPMLEAQAAEQFQNAEQKRQLTQSTMASHAAQAREADAHTALYGQQVAEKQQQMDRGGLGETLMTAALMNKVPMPQAREFSQYAQTGQLAPLYNQPADGRGPSVPAPEYADPNGQGGRIMQTLGLLRGGLTMGGHDIADVTKASGQLQQQDNIRGVIANPSTAGNVGQAYAAVDGKPLLDAIGNTGRGYNKFTGEGSTLAPGVAALYDQDERAQIGQRNAAAGASTASAASSYASAAHSRASTEKVRQEIEQGARTGALQVVTGPNGEITVVDKFNRTAQPVLGGDGKPVVKGAAGGGGKPMTEGQAKANLFGGRMMESGKVLDDMEAAGVLRPGAIKSAAEGVAGAIPIIGDALAGGVGAATNWTQSPKQQQVEQAQRDFLNAVLRRESGAAIGASEFTNGQRQYFPVPGDKPEVLAQKRRNRQIATTLMLQEVPETSRYRLGAAVEKSTPNPAAPQQGGATGDFGPAPAAGGWSIQRVN